MTRRLSPFATLVGLLTLTLGLAASPAPAQEDPTQDDGDKVYELSNYDVSIALRPDGAMDIRETMHFPFSEGYRALKDSLARRLRLAAGQESREPAE